MAFKLKFWLAVIIIILTYGAILCLQYEVAVKVVIGMLFGVMIAVCYMGLYQTGKKTRDVRKKWPVRLVDTWSRFYSADKDEDRKSDKA